MPGVLVWAHAGTPVQLQTLASVCDRMEEEGDRPCVIVTGSDQIRAMAMDMGFATAQGVDIPQLKGATPDVLLWMIADLRSSLLRHACDAQIPVTLMDAGAGDTMPNAGWVPGQLRRRLRGFDHIVAVDAVKAERLIKAGAAPESVQALGHFRDLPLPEQAGSKRAADMSTKIGPRPIWLALGIPATEIHLVLDAYLRVSRHAPRALLVMTMTATESCGVAWSAAQDRHLQALNGADGALPEDLHQVLVVPHNADSSIWLRLASVTYLGGSLSIGTQSDPLAAAQLGSVVIHGPQHGAYDAALGLLREAAASGPIPNSAHLADRVTTLMVPSQAAEIAAAAWQVLSEGANATNFIVDIIRGEA